MNLTTEPTITVAEVTAALRAAGMDLRATLDGGARIIRRDLTPRRCDCGDCQTRASVMVQGAALCAHHASEAMRVGAA